jgi:hypothetical protein
VVGKISIGPLITHTLKLEKVNLGLELMQRGDSIRSVVVYRRTNRSSSRRAAITPRSRHSLR